MLHRLCVTRLAFQRSPEREQRLLAYQQQATPPNQDDVPETVAQFRNDLLSANTDPARRQFIETHRHDLESVLRPETALETLSADDVIGIVDQIRSVVTKEVQQEQQLASVIAGIDPIREEPQRLQSIISFYPDVLKRYGIEGATPVEICTKIQALFNDSVLRANREFERKYRESRDGAMWSFLNAEQFAERAGITGGRVPSAFIENGIIYFNIDHPSFRDSPQRETYMKRVVAHETTHLAGMKNAATEKGLAQEFMRMPLWSALKNAVLDLTGKEEMAAFSGGNDDLWAFQEAIATYAAQAQHPLDTSSMDEVEAETTRRQERIAEIFGTIAGSMSESKRRQLEELLGKARDYSRVNRWNAAEQKMDRTDLSVLLKESAETSAIQDDLLKEEKAFAEDFRRNNSPAADELKEKIGEEQAKRKAKNETIEGVMGSISNCRGEISRFMSSKNTMLGYMQKTFQGDEYAKQSVAFEQICQELGGYTSDLDTMERYLNAATEWETMSVSEKREIASVFPENPYAEMPDDAPEAAVKAADAACKDYLATLVDAARDTVAGIAIRVDLQKKTMESIDASEKRNASSGEVNVGVWSWLKQNVLRPGANGHIMWVTPRNMMKIFNIYKEAIIENYNNNQSLKEYNIARKLNFYKPIEHTLKKQAKAANEKETGEFKEYIEREGYTFDELFGTGGKGMIDGLLYENRHNFNRAKAVLLYAADHAWLYHMDRFKGHDVYGIDYEGIEGKKSFEELVQMYESGKEKEEKSGYEKVDKHPDIPPMIEDMRHELERKNVFAVRGILKRIQEKGKVGEANTWATAEMVRMMRDPAIMAVMDKGFLDDVGNIGIGQSAWTLTMFKLMRHSFEDYRTGKIKDIRGTDDAKNYLVRAIDKAQALLMEGGISEGNTDLQKGMDRYIGRILAGQTVTVGGKTISIFQNHPEFNDYRKFWATTPTSTEPGKTDDDYFSASNEGSDLLMLPKTSISAILVRTSQGQWTHTTRAPNYMAQVIYRDIDLGRRDPQAQAKFREEMGSRLNYFFSEAVSHTATRENIGDDTTPSTKDSDISDKNIILELWQRGMLSEEYFFALLDGQKDINAMPPAMKNYRTAKDATTKAKTALDEAKKAADDAKKALENAKDAADTARKQTALDAAQAALLTAQTAKKDADKAFSTAKAKLKTASTSPR